MNIELHEITVRNLVDGSPFRWTVNRQTAQSLTSGQGAR